MRPPGVISVIQPKELSWAESAMLAVLPNAPAMIHLSKGRETLLAKRNRVLKLLHEKEIIDSSTYELAVSEPLPEEPHLLPQTAPHLVSRFYKKEMDSTHIPPLTGGFKCI